MRVTLIDSPVANVANIARALRSAGADVRLTRDTNVVTAARKIVLPGVGSFIAAMRWLEETRIAIALRDAVDRGGTLLGICVGHQLLFESSNEMGVTRGLGLLPGDVELLQGPLPVPQVGWNAVEIDQPTLFAGIASGTPFYFVHSYAVRDADSEIARANYGQPYTAAAQSGRVFGVQFHPEKSSTAGLRVLRNFVEMPT